MIDPIRAASFPCGEIPRHRKKAVKKTPKKADHKHEYEPVIFRYTLEHFKLTDRGFISGRSYSPGRRCTICGRLEHGFDDRTLSPIVYNVIKMPRPNGEVTTIHLLKEEYRHLPVVNLKDYFKLEKEENKND